MLKDIEDRRKKKMELVVSANSIKRPFA